MDANETRYHLLLGRDDWANCLAADGHPLSEHWLASPVMHNESGLDWHTANDELTLQARVAKGFLGFGRKIVLEAYCAKARRKVDEPQIGCGQCHGDSQIADLFNE